MKEYQYQILKSCLQREVMDSEKEFSWFRTLHRAIKCPGRRFYFWWRIANYLYKTGGKASRKYVISVNRRLRNKYGTDINLGADIGPGMKISHFVGIVVADCCEIGSNLNIKQNVTIGIKYDNQSGKIYIGDNVIIGANSCIIGCDISIGNNVTIGAMSFVDKNVPNDCVVYNQRTDNLIYKQIA